MTIFEYLANFSTNRSTDKVFISWYRETYTLAFIKREKSEWQSIYKEFMGEKELDPQKPKFNNKSEKISEVVTKKGEK